MIFDDQFWFGVFIGAISSIGGYLLGYLEGYKKGGNYILTRLKEPFGP